MIEVLKQALEALESCGGAHITDGGYQWHDAKLVDTAITSLRKAIQEEALRNVQRIGQEIEQEPIANLEIVDLGDGNKHFDNHWLSDLHSLPCGDYLLYTHPPQRKCENCGEFGKCCIETESQEPVAWNSGVPPLYPQIKDDETISVEYLETTPQPQRTWVGLTDEDIRPLCKEWWMADTAKQWVAIIEAKLKEKNGFAEEKNT